jgi:D-alanyl-D-alanine carboxypeptidase
MGLLGQQDAAEAGNFRSTVLTAVEAGARAERGGTGPAMVEMIRKITEALDAT